MVYSEKQFVDTSIRFELGSFKPHSKSKRRVSQILTPPSVVYRAQTLRKVCFPWRTQRKQEVWRLKLNSQLDILAKLNELSCLSWGPWSNLTWQRPEPGWHRWGVSEGQVKDHKTMILEHKTKIAENVLEPGDCNSKVTPAGSLTESRCGSDPGSNEPIKTSRESKRIYRCEPSGPRWSGSEVWMQVTRPVSEKSSI